MKTRYALIVAAIVIVAACAAVSFTSTSVDSSGQFSRLEDGTVLYTHHLTNRTWHPIRYSVAADPDSGVQTTLVRWDSSNPERIVTREPLAKQRTGKSASSSHPHALRTVFDALTPTTYLRRI